MENLNTIFEKAKKENIEKLIASVKSAVKSAVMDYPRSEFYLKDQDLDFSHGIDNVDDLVIYHSLNGIVKLEDFANMLENDDFFKSWNIRSVGEYIVFEKE